MLRGLSGNKCLGDKVSSFILFIIPVDAGLLSAAESKLIAYEFAFEFS